MKVKKYRCFGCRKTFQVTSFWEWLAAPHFDFWGIRYFKCPNCNNRNWAEIVKEQIMKNIHIENSYNIWNPEEMKYRIYKKCREQYDSDFPESQLNRTYISMYIEWWLHNIGYYVTKPFCIIEFFNKINIRCKDIDVNERVR